MFEYTSLVFSNFIIGLFGGMHCVVMCGPFCSFLQLKRDNHQFVFFQIARILGYGLIGLLLGLSSKYFAILGSNIKSFHPLWVMMHSYFLVWGIYLIAKRQQPSFITYSAGIINRKINEKTKSISLAMVGLLWSLIPCGMLFSAYFVAIISSKPSVGFLSMIAFGFGTVFFLLLAKLTQQTSVKKAVSERISYLITGSILSIISLIALYIDFFYPITVWCN